MKLCTFDNSNFKRDASTAKEMLWILVSGIAFSSWFPGSQWRVILLRLFGAKIGREVVVKPKVFIKFPWKLTVDDFSWIGEAVWIDNLAHVSIGKNTCISQGAYLCTGSHNWKKPTFDLIVKPIKIGDQAWIGAFCRVAPGVVVQDGAVLGFGSVATASLQSWSINFGQPAKKVKARVYE